MVYRLTVDAGGVISLPREALEALGPGFSGYVRLSPSEGNLVIERSPLQIVAAEDKI